MENRYLRLIYLFDSASLLGRVSDLLPCFGAASHEVSSLLSALRLFSDASMPRTSREGRLMALVICFSQRKQEGRYVDIFQL